MELTQEESKKRLKSMNKEQLVWTCTVLLQHLQLISEAMKKNYQNDTLTYVDELQTAIITTHYHLLDNNLEDAFLEIGSLIASDPCLTLRSEGLW